MRELDMLTPEDITDIVDVETEKQKDFFRMMAWLIYTGASLTAVGIHNPKSFPTLEDTFPSLFEKKEQQDWWVMKQRVEEYRRMKVRDGALVI